MRRHHLRHYGRREVEAVYYKLHEPRCQTALRVSARHTGATKRVLQQQLNEMERMGLVSKEVFAEVPVRVEYSLTKRGLSLLPIIRSMDTWGLEHAHLFNEMGQLKKSPE